MMMKIYYQPNGGISAVPDLVSSFVLKVFGCKTPEDYKNGHIFFIRERGARAMFVKEVSDFGPDIILIETLSAEMITAIIEIRKFFNGPVILFWGDLIEQNTYMLLRKIGKYVDLALVVDKNTERIFMGKGLPVRFTLFPASSLMYRPQPSIKKNLDTVFAGNLPDDNWFSRNHATMERLELVKAFSARPQFGLFGGESWKKYGLPVRGWVDEYTLSQVYNQAKIILAADQYLEIPGFTSNRTTKALLSGSFLLIRRFAGIEEIFENHRQLVWFDTVAEAIELADYYLDHEDERNEIAQNGLDFARDKMDLLPNIYKWIGIAQPRTTYSICWGTEFWFRLWSVLYFLRRGLIRLGGEAGLLSTDWFRQVG